MHAYRFWQVNSKKTCQIGNEAKVFPFYLFAWLNKEDKVEALLLHWVLLYFSCLAHQIDSTRARLLAHHNQAHWNKYIATQPGNSVNVTYSLQNGVDRMPISHKIELWTEINK